MSYRPSWRYAHRPAHRQAWQSKYGPRDAILEIFRATGFDGIYVKAPDDLPNTIESSVVDSSGNHHDFSAANTSQSATVKTVNNHPSLLFDGTDDLLTTSNGVVIGNDYTMAIAFRFDTKTAGHLFSTDNGDSYNGARSIAFQILDASTCLFFDRIDPFEGVIKSNYISNVPTVARLVHTKNGQTMFINGKNLNTGSVKPSSTTKAMHVALGGDPDGSDKQSSYVFGAILIAGDVSKDGPAIDRQLADLAGITI